MPEPSPTPESATGHPSTALAARVTETPTLRRELLAILVLYLTQVILPLLAGLVFGPESP